MLVILLFGNYQNVHADVFLQRYCNIRLSFISLKKKLLLGINMFFGGK